MLIVEWWCFPSPIRVRAAMGSGISKTKPRLAKIVVQQCPADPKIVVVQQNSAETRGGTSFEYDTREGHPERITTNQLAVETTRVEINYENVCSCRIHCPHPPSCLCSFLMFLGRRASQSIQDLAGSWSWIVWRCARCKRRNKGCISRSQVHLQEKTPSP